MKCSARATPTSHGGSPPSSILELRGLARVERKKYSGAIADYTRAIELRSDLEIGTRIRLLNRRGWAYYFADAPGLALADFEESLRLTPEQSDAVAGRGLARIRLGQWRLAVADAEAAVRSVKTSPTSEDGLIARREAYFNAARIHAQALEFAANEVPRQGERRRHPLSHLPQPRTRSAPAGAVQVPETERAKLLSDPAPQAAPPRLRSRAAAAARCRQSVE